MLLSGGDGAGDTEPGYGVTVAGRKRSAPYWTFWSRSFKRRD